MHALTSYHQPLQLLECRNGTPRQPLLVPAARSRLNLLPHIPSRILEGLDQYTHCWVIYVFHLNTGAYVKSHSFCLPCRTPYIVAYMFLFCKSSDWHSSADLHHAQSRKGIKAKIKPPRLNGQAMGVLATRAPHRPNPIGLSLCKIVRVGETHLVLGGADIVDGTPVLDVKPYVPFCECLCDASAPTWVVVRSCYSTLATASKQGLATSPAMSCRENIYQHHL